jgi:peptidoglycan/xylan/chitin deacetylase (PgdA/CDA1 family)
LSIHDWPAHIFLSAAQRRLFRGGVPVFMFHKLASPPARTRDPFDYMRPERFEAKLAALHQAGLHALTLDELFAPGRTTPQDGFVVTFDDGYQNVWQNGLEILRRHQIKATVFLVAGRLGQTNQWDVAEGEVPEKLMDEAQVRDWLAAGHSIGSHSLQHRVLKRLSQTEAREEIAGSKKRLEDAFGVPVRHFCYPSGKHSSMVRDLVQEAGYATACTVAFGVNGPQTPPLELRRISPLYGRELAAKAFHRLARKLRFSG